MAIIKQDYGSIGGGITSILADTNATELGNITSTNVSYTATQDCIMIGYIYGTSANSAGITVKDANNTSLGQLLYSFAGANTGSNNCNIGYNNSGLGFAIPKGYTVTSGNLGTYNLHFYPIK